MRLRRLPPRLSSTGVSSAVACMRNAPRAAVVHSNPIACTVQMRSLRALDQSKAYRFDS